MNINKRGIAATIASLSIAAGLVAVSPAPAAEAQSLPKVKRGTVLSAAAEAATTPGAVPGSASMTVKRNGKTVSHAARYKIRKPGKYKVTVTYRVAGTAPQAIDYLGSVECRVTSEAVAWDRTTHLAEWGYLDGQVDTTYGLACTAIAYPTDVMAPGQPVAWTDTWTDTDEVFTPWAGTTGRTATLLADNAYAVGDVAWSAPGWSLPNRPTMLGAVPTEQPASSTRVFRVR
jgi:hypothetical protein